MSEDRSERFGWSAGDIEITKRPPPRDRDDENRRDEARPEERGREDVDDD